MTNPDREELVKLDEAGLEAAVRECARITAPEISDDEYEQIKADNSPRYQKTRTEMARAVRAYLASSEDAVKVRKLEWVEMPDRDPESASWIAETDLGRSYRVFAAWWGAQHKYGYVFDGFYHTEADAKAAAQADYEARIRSALVEVPAVKGEPEPVASERISQLAADLVVSGWTAGDHGIELAKRRAERKLLEFACDEIERHMRSHTAPPADAGMREAYSALCLPRESQASDNLEGTLYDIERLSAQGKPTDHVCIRTLKRVLKQLVTAERDLTAPGATTKSDGTPERFIDSAYQIAEELRKEDCPSDPSPTRSDVTALTDIAKERQRQREVKGWSLAHDDAHVSGELAMAGACYALASSLNTEQALNTTFTRYWPWGRKWWKPKTPRENLVRAGALIVAEIERIDRLDQFEIRRK